MTEENLLQQLAEAQDTIRALREELAETSRGLLALDMELEDRVAERTAQLEAANVSLRREIRARERAEKETERLLVAEREARKQAEEAVRMRDEFISVAAHELKTPVTSLQGFAQLLSRQYEKTGELNPERVIRAMQAISKQSKRLTKLTEQLLNSSRIYLGKLMLAPEETDLSKLVGDTIASVSLSNPRRNIQFRDGGHICAVVDPLRLEQVITNILDNAIKFSPSESIVEVVLRTMESDWVSIVIRDHGIGVPEGERALIFERFHQAHPERHAGGMGIGLYVSREIVEMHGGTLTLEQPDGTGSQFVIRLPATCDMTSAR